MQLIPWSFQTQHGFTLRGQHSVPSGKPLLHFLHGNGYCSLMYLPLLRQLEPYFDLFLSDAQGHGDSDHGGAFVGWNQSAVLASQAFQAHLPLFGEVPLYACGHSFGGVLTALINASNPQLFSRVILLDPVLFPPLLLNTMRTLNFLGLYQGNPMAKKARRRKDFWPSRLDAKQYLAERGMFKGWHNDALDAYINHALHHDNGLRLKCQPTREAEIFGSYPKALWQALKKPCAPTLMLYGQHSYPFVEKAAMKWRNINQAVTTQQVAGGHCFMQQHPEATAQLLLRHWGLLHTQPD